MAEKALELKIMHCKDLTAFNFFQKLNVFALVSIVNDENNNHENENLTEPHNLNKLQEQKTPTDTEGDANPEWNHEMKFDLSSVPDLNDDRLFLHFDLHSENAIIQAIGGDRCIGHVWIPLKDLLQSPNVARFVNYEVRSLDKQPNGAINFSFKFVLSFKQHDSSVTFPTIDVNGYPINHQNHCSPSNLYPPPSTSVEFYPTPSPEIYPPPINTEIHSETNSYHDAVSTPSVEFYPPPSPSVQIYPPPINTEIHSETNSPHFYHDAVSTPVTPYSPQHGFVHHHHQQHPFSPLRPPPLAVYPPPPPPEMHAYPPHQHPDYHPNVLCAHYPPHPSDHLFGVANGSDYCQTPGSSMTPFSTQTTTWPGHYPPEGDHFSPSWNTRPHM